MTPDYVNSSSNFLKLRRYQRCLEHHFPDNYQEHEEYRLIDAFISLPPGTRTVIADSETFSWLNMKNTTFI
jgi:hypothetical protein